MSSDPDHIKLMEDVALHFLGPLNTKQSNNDRTKLRFGTNGSVSVDLTKGVWYDWENNIGGGAVDLIMRETGLSETRAAYEWAESEGYWTNGKINGAASDRSSLGPIVATYDYVDEQNTILYHLHDCLNRKVCAP